MPLRLPPRPVFPQNSMRRSRPEFPPGRFRSAINCASEKSFRSACDRLNPTRCEVRRSTCRGIEAWNISRNRERRAGRKPEGRTYTFLPKTAKRVRPAIRQGKSRHPAAKKEKERNPRMAKRTPQQRLKDLELKANRLRLAISKSERSRDAHGKIVVAVALLAEANDDAAFADKVSDICKRRVTRPHDIRDLPGWITEKWKKAAA